MELERKYGAPEIIHPRQAMFDMEFDLLVGSMNSDRARDVTLAAHVSGVLQQIDTREIAEVKPVSLEHLQGSIRDNLLATGSGGLAYKVALTDKVVELLDGAGVVDPVGKPLMDRAVRGRIALG